MKRTPSPLAQSVFDITSSATRYSHEGGFVASLSARAVKKIGKRVLRKIGANHTVVAQIYGHVLVMPSEHPLVATLAAYPKFNRPLGLAAVAIANASPAGTKHAVIDVGANIGETAALIEQMQPGVFHYLCLEPDPDLAEMCKINHRTSNNVEVIQCFIGENEGSVVQLQDDGRANPSTKLVSDSTVSENVGCLLRLDTVARPFATSNSGISLVKVDTEGYDFAVLRSGVELLKQYKPAVYFEWFPDALMQVGEDFYSGFDFLQNLGYRFFVFFTSQGNYHCSRIAPDKLFLRGLVSVVGANSPFEYFDVFACESESVFSSLIERSISVSEDNQRRQLFLNRNNGSGAIHA